jgi:hypothetical protein
MSNRNVSTLPISLNIYNRYMWDLSKMINLMDLEEFFLKLEPFSWENSKKENVTVMESFCMKMVIYTLDSMRITLSMEKEKWHFTMEIFIKVNGKEIREVVNAILNMGKQEIYLLEIFLKIRDLAKENSMIRLKMKFMMVSGHMIKEMVKVLLSKLMEIGFSETSEVILLKEK